MIPRGCTHQNERSSGLISKVWCPRLTAATLALLVCRSHSLAMTERWRDIPGYEGYYAISDLGRIKRLPRRQGNGKGWVNLPARLLRATVALGCEVVCLNRDGKKQTFQLTACRALPS